jgi:hypothetical protein
MEEVEDLVEDIDGDEEEELGEAKKLGEQVRAQHNIVNGLKVQTKGLNESQKEELLGILEQLENVTGKVQVKLNEKNYKAQIKIKAKHGLDSAEVASLEGAISDALDIEQTKGLHKPTPPPGQAKRGAAESGGTSPGKDSDDNTGHSAPGQAGQDKPTPPGQAKKGVVTGNVVKETGKASAPGQAKKGEGTGSDGSASSSPGKSGSAGSNGNSGSASTGGSSGGGKGGSKGGSASSGNSGGSKGKSGSSNGGKGKSKGNSGKPASNPGKGNK